MGKVKSEYLIVFKSLESIKLLDKKDKSDLGDLKIYFFNNKFQHITGMSGSPTFLVESNLCSIFCIYLDYETIICCNPPL